MVIRQAMTYTCIQPSQPPGPSLRSSVAAPVWRTASVGKHGLGLPAHAHLSEQTFNNKLHTRAARRRKASPLWLHQKRFITSQRVHEVPTNCLLVAAFFLVKSAQRRLRSVVETHLARLQAQAQASRYAQARNHPHAVAEQAFAVYTADDRRARAPHRTKPSPDQSASPARPVRARFLAASASRCSRTSSACVVKNGSDAPRKSSTLVKPCCSMNAWRARPGWASHRGPYS